MTLRAVVHFVDDVASMSVLVSIKKRESALCRVCPARPELGDTPEVG